MFMNKWITCSGTSWHFFFGFLLHFFRGWDEGIWTHSLSSICQSVWSTHVFSHIVATLFWVAATLRLLMVAVTNLVGNFQMIQAVVAILFLMEFLFAQFFIPKSPLLGGFPRQNVHQWRTDYWEYARGPLANLIVAAGPHIMAGLDIRSWAFLVIDRFVARFVANTALLVVHCSAEPVE